MYYITSVRISNFDLNILKIEQLTNDLINTSNLKSEKFNQKVNVTNNLFQKSHLGLPENCSFNYGYLFTASILN